jgi:predicted ATPase/DNA-binding CsgD family transcriptional regulator
MAQPAQSKERPALDQPLGFLPHQSTPFVGREKERMLLRTQLGRGDVRLITLTGPGGAGKTRLALQLALDARDGFPDGVVFVPLASVGDPALVLPAIANAFGVIDTGPLSLIARLGAALRTRQLLLVLDNFEQVLPAAPEVAMLLASTQHMKVLATSRAPLHISWEHQFPISPLAMPQREVHPSLEQLRQYDAIRFFLMCAQAVRPDFVLTDHNASMVVELCRRLDGLPLAIELATARLRLFSLQVLLARLDRPLLFLTGGARDLPARHQTLHATIAWSYNLLNAEEQTLFARMAVFAGGCTLAQAETICGDMDGRSDHVLGGIESLCHQHLLQRMRDAADESRFAMLATIQEYAWEQLRASGEQAAIRGRHAQAFRALVELAATKLEGSDQATWLNRLEDEHDNLRAAIDWAIEEREVEFGLQLVTVLRLFWFLRGHMTEGRERLAQMLALGGAPVTRARALDCAGFLARYQGDDAEAAAQIGESLALWRTLGDQQGIANALSNLSYVLLHQGDYATARAMYQEALDLYRALGNEQGRADCLSHLGLVEFFEGEYAAAQALHQQSLAIWQVLGDTEGIAYALHHLGDCSLAQGDGIAAAKYLQGSLQTSATLGWSLGIVNALEGVAGVAAWFARPVAALQLAAAAAHLRQTFAIQPSAARAHLLARRLEPARQALSEAERAAAWATGSARDLEWSVGEALAELAAMIASAVPPAHPPSPPPPGGLTAREHDVAILIAQGYPNRAIAKKLVVSVKTVEAHMSRILTKLGFSSRAQVAAWAVARGLAPAPSSLDEIDTDASP